MVHKLKPKTWVVWSGYKITEEVGWKPEQIAMMLKRGDLALERYKPDMIKVTDAKGMKTLFKKDYTKIKVKKPELTVGGKMTPKELFGMWTGFGQTLARKRD